METQIFNSPLLGKVKNSRLSYNRSVSSLSRNLKGLSCRVADSPKRASSDTSFECLPAKRAMYSLTPSNVTPRCLSWDSLGSHDSGFASFGSTTSSLNFDLDDDASIENDEPAVPAHFSNLLRAPLQELSSNSILTESRSPLKLRRRSRLHTTSEKRIAANFKEASPSNKKTKGESENLDQHSIKIALSRSDECCDLIADFSARYSLPRCQSKHSDLQGISPETVSNLLQGQYSAKIGKFTIVDCRYPYEYQGGHIQGAENIYTKTDIKHRFMTSNEFLKSDDSDKRNVIIFHCEFSSERGPRMCRYLREIDRQHHADQYPKLNYPEMYILEGGYKAFYEHKIDHCVPQSYLPMLHADHSQDLKHFRAKTKSMNGSKAGRRRPLRY